MKYKKILITGGCGFVGSTLALNIKTEFPDTSVTVLDNFFRKGSELNIPRLESSDITILKADVRDRPAILEIPPNDLIIDCAAEPSVLAGRDGSPLVVTDINLGGTINCLELARIHKADFIFLSTSRVYPIELLNSLTFEEQDSRFQLSKQQPFSGVSEKGITEIFPLGKHRSIYGATKLSSEFIIQEFCEAYGIRAVINRCGVIAGPWQFGKVDQGVAVLWMARHIFKKELSYIGFGGAGKQVRDILHVDDLWNALKIQLSEIEKYSGEIFNIGGGQENSISLKEMTALCQKISGNTIPLHSVSETRPGDIKLYITDYSKFQTQSGWKPQKTVEDVFNDVHNWIVENKESLESILN